MDPFLGQISLLGCNFAPQGWALCQGQLLSVSQNAALFSLLGVNFGGDGRANFQLPDLRGRAPAGFGQGPGLSAYSEQNCTWSRNSLSCCETGISAISAARLQANSR